MKKAAPKKPSGAAAPEAYPALLGHRPSEGVRALLCRRAEMGDGADYVGVPLTMKEIALADEVAVSRARRGELFRLPAEMRIVR